MNDADNDWVAHLLRAAATPAMPEDVAQRLDRTLRSHLDADTLAADTQAPDTTPRVDTAPRVADTPAEAGTPGAVGTLGTAATPATPEEHDGPAAAVTDRTPDSDTDINTDTDTATVARPAAAGTDVPPAARPALVPPAAGTGAVPTLRSTSTAGDGSATEDGTDPPGLAAARTRSGRSWGSSRRQQRAEDQGERRRRLLTRWAPVAAGVLVLGGAGITAATLVGGQDAGSIEAQDEAAAAGAAEAVVPRALVATGTEYQTADRAVFDEQVRALVSVAGSGGSESLAAPQGDTDAAAESDAVEDAAPVEEGAVAGSQPPDGASLDPAAAREAVTSSPLADAEAFQECVEQVTDVTGGTATAMDLAVVDGVQSTVVVVPDATGESLFVYVVGPDCAVTDSQFQFFTVTP